MTVPMILNAYERLKSEGRLNQERRRAVALGLWGCVQAAFFLKPSYWYRIAKLAQRIDPTARPEQTFYQLPVIKNIDPLAIQLFMMPKRLMFYHFDHLLKKLRIRHKW